MKKLYLLKISLILFVLSHLKVQGQCAYPIPTINVVNGVICNGSPAILSVPDDYDAYQWYWGSVPIPVAADTYGYWAVVQGYYHLELVLNGCTSQTAPVYISAPLVQPINFPDTLYSCTDSLVIQMDTLLYDNFMWHTGETTSALTVHQSGWVGVGAGIDALSCGVADTFWVELNRPSPTVSINVTGNNPFCQDSSITLEATPVANQYSWNTGDQTQSITVNAGGNYIVTVTNFYGCTASDTVLAIVVPCPPSTQLSSLYCPNYGLVKTSAIFCDPVQGATQYEWVFTQGGNPFATKITTNPFTVLHGVSPAPQFGNVYQVQIRPYVGGQWGAFGAICEIGLVPQPTPATVPLTQLRSEDCGKLNYRFNANNRIVAIPVFQAIAYEFEFKDAITNIVVATYSSPFPVCFFNMVTPTLTFPAQFYVSVRVNYGGVWGYYGNSCLIGIIGINKEAAENQPNELIGGKNILFEASLYPNPFDQNVTVSVLSSDKDMILVKVFDVTGKQVDEFQMQPTESKVVGGNYESGLYIVKLSATSGINKTLKLIKN